MYVVTRDYTLTLGNVLQQYIIGTHNNNDGNSNSEIYRGKNCSFQYMRAFTILCDIIIGRGESVRYTIPCYYIVSDMYIEHAYMCVGIS